MELLTAYLRENSPRKPQEDETREIDEADARNKPYPPSLRLEIQAIVAVLGRRERGGEREVYTESVDGVAHSKPLELQLAETDLRGAGLFKGNFAHANFFRANLCDASMQEADFDGCEFERTFLGKAKLCEATAKGAGFAQARLPRANLYGADLSAANFGEASLQGASLVSAIFSGANLRNCDLTRADLSKARLDGADLQGARLDDAHLKHVDLSATEGLTQEQLDKSWGDRQTVLPEGLERPSRWHVE